jgi:hypothetical protein
MKLQYFIKIPVRPEFGPYTKSDHATGFVDLTSRQADSIISL